MRYWLIYFSAIWIEKQQLAKRLVHIIDREADSVAHLRQWRKVWLVWVKAGSHMRCGGTKMALSAVAEQFALFELRLLEANDNPISGLYQIFTGQKSTSA